MVHEIERRRRPRRLHAERKSRGQALVEFALAFPFFVVLLMALIEFAFLMNGQLSISYATRDAALIAAEAGNGVGSDCLILQKVQQDVTAPANAQNITEIVIYWTNSVGQSLDTSGAVTAFGSANQAVDRYVPGTMTCTFADGATLTVPYQLQGAALYPESARCNAIRGTGSGCLAGHTGLDTVGVQVTYNASWRTPLHGLIGLSGNGWTLVQSNQMRLEPVL
jgi:Flp pilus assembly protein TadG